MLVQAAAAAVRLQSGVVALHGGFSMLLLLVLHVHCKCHEAIGHLRSCSSALRCRDRPSPQQRMRAFGVTANRGAGGFDVWPSLRLRTPITAAAVCVPGACAPFKGPQPSHCLPAGPAKPVQLLGSQAMGAHTGKPRHAYVCLLSRQCCCPWVLHRQVWRHTLVRVPPKLARSRASVIL